jgi:sugar O-acyltransferase (sialic acid O-acetyltransferase NeuD family)
MPDSPLVVYGAGTQGQCILEWLLASQPGQAVLLADDNPALWGAEVFGLLVRSPERVLLQGPRRVMVTIGDNTTRARILDRLRAQGYQWQGFAHPRAVIAPSAKVDESAIVLANAVVNPGACVGAGSLINTASVVEHHCQLEAFVHLAPGALLGGGVKVQEGAFVGLGAKVLPNRTVGPWATVGAGSVVLRDVHPGATVAGCPARMLHEHPSPLRDETNPAVAKNARVRRRSDFRNYMGTRTSA